MKTVIRIEVDHMGDGAYQEWKDDIEYIVNNEVDVEVEIENDRYINIVRAVCTRDLSGEYDSLTRVQAKGYSQGDWQVYKVRYKSEDEDNPHFKALLVLLERTFTHKHDYAVQRFMRTEIDGVVFNAEPHDHTWFSITDVEFPDKEDVLKAYQDQYGEDYDEVELECTFN